jgi:transcriptional regulator with XRE-family HTH domain
MDHDDDVTAPQIGAQVKARRKARGWSMRELARRAGVSQPFVSKLEAGQLLPSLPTLYGLAAVFEIPASALLPSPEAGRSAPEVHLPLSEAPGSADVRLIAGGPGSAIQTFEFSLRAGEGDLEFFHHGGEEVVYVIEGTVISEREGLPSLTLGRGDSLRIDPSVAHRWTTDAEAAVFLLICSEPPAALSSPRG